MQILVDKRSKGLNPYASQSYTVITVISGYNNFINKKGEKHEEENKNSNKN